MRNGEITQIRVSALPPRMSGDDAVAHYKAKVRDCFDNKLTVEDFDKNEDYFGFFEAKKILKELGNE